MKNVFNSKALAAAILAKREKENLSFRGIQKFTKGKIKAMTLQQIEAGQSSVSTKSLVVICNWLEVDAGKFFKPVKPKA